MQLHVLCTAVLDNDQQQDNLIQCIKILGGEPQVSRNTVCVEFVGAKDKAEKFIELFEHYSRHSIVSLQ